MLHVLNLIWFGYIARLSQWGGGGLFPRSNDFYLPLLQVEEGGQGVGTLWSVFSGLTAREIDIPPPYFNILSSYIGPRGSMSQTFYPFLPP